MNIAQGHVRCNHCQHIFNAANHLLKSSSDSESDNLESFQLDDDEQDIDLKDFDIPELLKEDIDEPVRGRSWTSFFFLGIMVILLSLALAAQTMWFFQRDKVLQHQEVRPWLERFCYHFLCTLPPTRDLSRFKMQDHVAQLHPEINDALQFEATFINNAYFRQPYPALQLIFEDLEGNPIAQRGFKPEEYLQRFLGKNEQMPANSSVHIKLILIEMSQVIEDNRIAEGYHFKFF
ncbi:conserved hypothetical protein [Beggiatoa sp. PS]|nr:conserved hypothetical protein [Beggiatoa sp. PS]